MMENIIAKFHYIKNEEIQSMITYLSGKKIKLYLFFASG